MYLGFSFPFTLMADRDSRWVIFDERISDFPAELLLCLLLNFGFISKTISRFLWKRVIIGDKFIGESENICICVCSL